MPSESTNRADDGTTEDDKQPGFFGEEVGWITLPNFDAAAMRRRASMRRGTTLLAAFMQGRKGLFPDGLWAMGDTLYSYGTPIARREYFVKTNGSQVVRVVLLPLLDEQRTMTTRKHVGMVRRNAAMFGLPLMAAEER